MNAWRCQKCHRIQSGNDIHSDGILLHCGDPACDGLVFDVTHTRTGQLFLSKLDDVPTIVKFQHMDKRIAFIPGPGETP